MLIANWYGCGCGEQICGRCIFRVFGVEGRVYASPSLSTSLKETDKLCSICLGILQFRFRDDSGTVLNKDVVDVPLLIVQMLKREGYHMDSFSLEVSIPPIILDNDNSLR